MHNDFGEVTVEKYNKEAEVYERSSLNNRLSVFMSCYFALICLIQSAAEQNYLPFAGISLADAALK